MQDFFGGGGGGGGQKLPTLLQNINGLIFIYNYIREISNMCITENTADGVASRNG